VAVGHVFRTAVVERVSRSRPTAWPSTSPPRTKWTRRVPHPVLIGHAAPGRRRGHQHGGGGTLRLGQAPRGRRALGARRAPGARKGAVSARAEWPFCALQNTLCVTEHSVRYRTLCALQNPLCVAKHFFFELSGGLRDPRSGGRRGASARWGRAAAARQERTKLYAMTLQNSTGGGWRGSSRRSYGRSGR